MKELSKIITNVSVNKILGDVNVQVDSIAFDSREVSKNTLFVAQKGLLTDGHLYINSAIEKGASVIVCEELPETIIENITYINVVNSNEALAYISSNFYENPSTKIHLVGVTGTNGKTTVATLLYNLFKKAGYKVGLLSTVKILINDNEYPTTHTTPSSVVINSYLALMLEQGVDYCFMEVSSHGIHQSRTKGLDFKGAIFTNLTHDHLDYHKTFEAYRDTKKILFDELSTEAFAIVNVDDKNGKYMLQNSKANKYSYALKSAADFKARILENHFSGMLLQINGNEIWSKLIGDFNAYNLLAVYGTSNLLGLDELEILTLLSSLESVSGRFQYVESNDGIIAIIDYAHTPDALKNVLSTVNSIKKPTENIITVVGCGGNRDKAKRPIMGRVASQLSQQVIFTSDNPRDEDPEVIISEMEVGVEKENQHKTLSIVNREQAIKTAIKLASKGDIVLVAGKGHETYQEIKGKRHHFDDVEVVKNQFNLVEK